MKTETSDEPELKWGVLITLDTKDYNKKGVSLLLHNICTASTNEELMAALSLYQHSFATHMIVNITTGGQ